MSKQAAIYIRMSTDKDEQKDSPEAQRSAIAPLVQREGYEIVGEYLDEGKSGLWLR